MSEELDRKLSALLALPDRAPDAAFAARIGLAIAAEERMRARRRALWRRGAGETAAVAVLLLSFLLLAHRGPRLGWSEWIPLSSPAMAGLVLLGLGLAALAGGKSSFARSNLHH
jgi:hypothetical protein